MDHSPGVGQYADLDRYRALRRAGGRAGRLSSSAASARCRRSARSGASQPARPARPGGGARRRPGQPRRPHRGGNRGELPRRHPHQRVPGAHRRRPRGAARGMEIIAGAPNIVRGGSHSGNVAAPTWCAPAWWTRWPATTCRPAWWKPRSCAGASGRHACPKRWRWSPTGRRACAACSTAAASPPGCAPTWCGCTLHDGLPVVRQVWRAGERVA